MKTSHLLTFSALICLIVLGVSGLIAIETAVFLVVLFVFTSVIAVFSDRYKNK